jgi:DNA-binding NtrC family response regulator
MNRRVLVVDDDPDVLRTLVRSLRGADVKVALGAEAALELVQREPVDAVIVDFNMRGPNGAWLLRRIRELDAGIYRILLSGSTYADLAGHLEPGLVDQFLGKPLEPDELVDAVNHRPDA